MLADRGDRGCAVMAGDSFGNFSELSLFVIFKLTSTTGDGCGRFNLCKAKTTTAAASRTFNMSNA